MRTKKILLIQPMLATLSDKPFNSKDWLFEIKLDGFRALAFVDHEKVALYSRNFLSFNERFPKIVKDLKKLSITAVFDGEIVALDSEGKPSFQLMQNYETADHINYYVFDILELNGNDLRNKPLIERKALLKKLLKKSSLVRYLDHVEEKGVKFFELCKKNDLEGIVAKKKNSLYKAGERSKEWLKIKTEMRQEIIICGFTAPRKSRSHFASLIAGVYRDGKLCYAGHVGQGFSEKTLFEIKKLLSPFITLHSPFSQKITTNTQATWVEPHFICEVKFKEWTQGGIMRMPIFQGLRDDKSVKEVVEEMPQKNQHYDFIVNPEKLFWPKEKITKQDLLNYYESISSYILPYLKDRPESLKRFPNGILQPSFFQKNVASYPDWLNTIKIEHSDKVVNYMMIQDVTSLLYAVNLGCIEIHPWFSRIQSLENPDYLILDLDPVDIAFEAVIETALAIHELLEELKVVNLCKTSGGRGLHIGIPLQAHYNYEQSKYFSELIAHLIHQQLPKITSLERSPAKRKHKVYIDCYQNNYGQTLAAPYSVRAKPGAPVSTPLEWSELKAGFSPHDYTIFTLQERLKKKGDLFAPILSKGVNFGLTLKRLRKMF